MSKVFINNQPVDCPKKKATVAELKELGSIPKRNLIYDEDGNVLSDDQVVDTTRTRNLGEVEDYTRG